MTTVLVVSGDERTNYEQTATRIVGRAAYDEGYLACACFWGREPGSLVRNLVGRVGSVQGWQVLDAGCGEGKNADHLWRLGAENVVALDVSARALANAKRAFPDSGVTWRLADVSTETFEKDAYNLVLLYGLLHCLADEDEVRRVVSALQATTRPGGWHLVCAFNDRAQDLSAHPGFHPCLLPHATFASLYAGWKLELVSDSDLQETHPHNQIEHIHSMTRLIARKV